MVENSTLARPYASAAFQIARQDGLQQWEMWLEAWAAIASSPATQSLVSNPKLTTAQVCTVFLELSETAANSKGAAFISVLAENHRLLVLPEILRQFVELCNQANQVAEAILESAFPISGEEVEHLKPGLEKHFESALNIVTKVNPELIGGIKVTVGDQILDRSVLAQIKSLEQKLLA